MFLIMGNAGCIPSTVVLRCVGVCTGCYTTRADWRRGIGVMNSSKQTAVLEEV